ncbi:DUF2911 domain-containing protein [Hymenobacter psychrophilus]|uniref:DUF2911 domain-containing protein n=1 Tax=Hymenobacter psychrophilus TaxID=651662 RepID=A0A1H3LQX9_9BACT|nr:DUF2911 domain-containing protein [Hymenobacter psychrophilus]SDY66730.1 Protein of unknown function [Hymenobacter psychrophilus]
MPVIHTPSGRNFSAPLLLALLGLAFHLTSCSEPDSPATTEKAARPSPAATVSATVAGGATFAIRYSRPSANERKVMGGLVPYGQVWRTGANEATTFTVDKPVRVQGRPLPAGKYALFTIPQAKEWTIIFNSQPNQWGAYEYEPTRDTLRVPAPVSTLPQRLEQFTITADKSGEVNIGWENTQATFKVE